MSLLNVVQKAERFFRLKLFVSVFSQGQFGGFMQRCYTLKKNKRFQFVFRRGSSYVCRQWVLRFIPYRCGSAFVGISVGKKVGGSVQRNYVKRIARENLRSYLPSLKPGLYVFLARDSASQATFYSVKRDFAYLLNKANLIPSV